MGKGDGEEVNVTDGEDETAAMRIYIGGVSSGVTSGDIEKTFSSMGNVTGVELVHSDSRSFAYMDFQPNSQKSLAKLFSTYNGCTWKGGKLKLEKAKEHYFARLKREWEEDAAKVMPATSVDPKFEKSECLNLEDMHLQMFFPKLRKKSKFGAKQSSRDGSSRNKEVTANCNIHPMLPVKITEDEFSAILPRKASSEVQSQELEAFAESPPDKSRTEVMSMSNAQSTKGHSWAQKSSWRDLVGEVGNNTPFSISHVLPDIIPVPQKLPKLDNPGILVSTTVVKKTTKAQSEKGKLRPSLVTTEVISPDHTEMTQVGNQIQANHVGNEQKESQNTSNQQPRRVIPKVGVSEVCPS